MSLFPLPAIIFLCCLILLLIVLAILYFTVLKKGITCCCMEGHAGTDNGEDAQVENGGETNGDPNANVTPGTEPTGDVTGGDGGGTDGGTYDTTDGGVGGGEGVTTPAQALIGSITPMTTAPPAGSPVDNGGGTATHDPQAGSQAGGGDEPAPAEPLCVAGKLLIQFTYMPAANKINLTVIRAGDMPPPERGGSENIQVHLCVLPMRKQRFRTKAVPVSKGVFNETFQFIHMTVDLVETCAIRMRVYGTQRFSRRLIGEAKIPLSSVDLVSPLADETIWKNLNPKGLVEEEPAGPETTMSESVLSVIEALEEPIPIPELLVNLNYQDLTGRLTVEVIKATNLRPETMLLNPDTFVKIQCVSGKGKKIGKTKTNIRTNSSDPEYNETFVYSLSPTDLKNATMMFTVFMVGKRRRKKRTIIGWFAYGQNTSGTAETSHWKEMVDNPNCDISQWQTLQTP